MSLYLTMTAVIIMPAFADKDGKLNLDVRRFINSGLSGKIPRRLTLERSTREVGEDDEAGWATRANEVGGVYHIGGSGLPPDLDFGGILTVRDENGKFVPVKEEDIGSGEDFYLFGRGTEGIQILSAGRKEADGSLRLTGSHRAGGKDLRSLERGFADVLEVVANVSDALGGDETAETARNKAANIRKYAAPKSAPGIAYEFNKSRQSFDISSAPGIAYGFNKNQQSFDITNSSDGKALFLSLIPFGIVGGIIGAIIGFVYVIIKRRDLTDTIIRFGGRGGLIGILLAIVIKFFS